MGSHGLDLSFVTHVFLMEEIWDKSLEQQVVSRAHRMGAQQAVVVEQLWMRGSIESEMAKMNELDERHSSNPPRVMHRLGPPVRTRKRLRGGGKALLNVAGTKRKKRNRRGDAKKCLLTTRAVSFSASSTTFFVTCGYWKTMLLQSLGKFAFPS
uniref:Helicase C-terminal domain-containing protein n=1 Tax=Hyaloperonospora arabidopsidis (strain Emoy2) TaxID=559515 RepID=M4B1I0_HYAAE